MSYLNNALHNRKILVTGATGFIGSRLAQRLAAEEGAVVTGTGRSLDKVPFLREAGVNLRQVALQDVDGMRQALVGQEVVYHAAAWLVRHGDGQAAHALNVTAVENTIRLAAEAGVRRFVHVSSVAAYGVPRRLCVDETHPLNPQQQDIYGRTKALGEMRAVEVAREVGLELVIVRPGMVYGPRAIGWSANMLRLVQKGRPVILGDGSGHAYPTYIDNLVDGMMKAAVCPQAAGEAFNLCDPVLTWRQWFHFYGQMCGRKPRRFPLWMARFLLAANGLFGLNLPLTRQRLQIYTLNAEFSSTKAERLLGWRPRLSIEEGMKHTETWLREAGYLK